MVPGETLKAAVDGVDGDGAVADEELVGGGGVGFDWLDGEGVGFRGG